MMKGVARISGDGADAVHGQVVWSPAKSLWNCAMILCTLTFAAQTATVGAVLAFLISTYLSLLLGHSVGMHRRFIHRSYECRKWLERTLVYIGVLVGVAGPLGILRIHDERDWAQRQTDCHDFFSHRRSPIIDLFWQLNCRFRFASPPTFTIEPEFSGDRWYRTLEKTWMLQQLAVAAACYLIGGWGWVVWCVATRVSLSVVGHWGITYWCHNPGQQKWLVRGVGVQASNLPGLGFLTYGECWHNNHHAFPESARIGIEYGQSDPAAWIIECFEKIGWAWDVGKPRPEQEREDLIHSEQSDSGLLRID